MVIRADNEGAKQLRQTGVSAKEISTIIGCALATATWWKSGRKVPSTAYRKKIQLKYNINAKLFDMAPVEDINKPKSVKIDKKLDPNLGNGASAGKEYAAAQVTRIQNWRRQLEANGASDATLLKAHALERQAVGQFLKANKELGTAPDTGKLLMSPQWADIQAAIIRAVSPYPDAARAVAEALKGLS